MKSIRSTLLLLTLLFLPISALAGAPSGWVIFWGYGIDLNSSPSTASSGVVTIAGQELTNAVAIAAGYRHALAIRSDCTVVGWGLDSRGEATGTVATSNDTRTSGIVKIDGHLLTNIVAIAAGLGQSQALRSDGTIAAWGGTQDGSTMHLAAGLGDAVSLAGWFSMVALRDGTVADIITGKTFKGLSNVVAISAQRSVNGTLVALHQDGTVTEGGLEATDLTIPVNVSNAVAISAGTSQYLALKSDGSVFEWGSGMTAVPAGLSNVVAISSGRRHNLALRKNGTVVTWGFNPYHNLDVPPGLSNVVAIAAGDDFSLAITTNKAVADKFRHY